MKYIIIKRVLKEKCPPGIKSVWSFDKISSELWEVWDEREIEESITPDIYTDQMDETVENYSRNYPEYFWEWCTEVREKVHYDILIDGSVYEGNENFDIALSLFDTVDYTCLREYYGHKKTLQVTQGNMSIKLKEGKIDYPLIEVVLYYSDGSKLDTFKKLPPEEAGTLLLQADSDGRKPIKVEVLNKDGEVVLEF